MLRTSDILKMSVHLLRIARMYMDAIKRNHYNSLRYTYLEGY